MAHQERPAWERRLSGFERAGLARKLKTAHAEGHQAGQEAALEWAQAEADLYQPSMPTLRRRIADRLRRVRAGQPLEES